jgi:flagellin-like hook-associated protein FlgL
MTISIQGSAAAVLTPLDQLQGGAAAAGAAPTPDPAPPESPSPIIDLSGLTTSALGGAGAGFSSDASIADAAVASGSIIEGLLAQMRDAADSAADPGVGADARAALNAGFQSGLSQIQAAVAAAGVDGVNLIDGGASNVQTPDGLATFDLSPSGSLIGLPPGASLSDPAAAASLAAQLTKALGNVGQAVSALAGQADDLHSSFVSALQSGSSSFDPTLDADGARLAALQIQQQLSAAVGSIGNQAPSAVLALFR